MQEPVTPLNTTKLGSAAEALSDPKAGAADHIAGVHDFDTLPLLDVAFISILLLFYLLP